MMELDHEHLAFEAYASGKGLDRVIHPLHLLYLKEETSLALATFQEGYLAGKALMQEENDKLKEELKGLDEEVEQLLSERAGEDW